MVGIRDILQRHPNWELVEDIDYEVRVGIPSINVWGWADDKDTAINQLIEHLIYWESTCK